MSLRSVQCLVKTGRVVLLFLCCEHAAVDLCTFQDDWRGDTYPVIIRFPHIEV
jgi:hypothetical protein